MLKPILGIMLMLGGDRRIANRSFPNSRFPDLVVDRTFDFKTNTFTDLVAIFGLALLFE